MIELIQPILNRLKEVENKDEAVLNDIKLYQGLLDELEKPHVLSRDVSKEGVVNISVHPK